MVSLDVASLYITIPIGQALLTIEDLLQHDNKLADRTPLSPNQILDILNMHSSTNNLFQIQQPILPTDGAAMGGPASAIVSEIYMQALEMTAITKADYPPKIWERHVDDVFSVTQRIYLQELHQINSCTHKHSSQKKKKKVPHYHFSTP